MLIIQCDSGHTDGDLIACARYHIYDMRAKALLHTEAQDISVAHVLFIIHLPVQAAGSSFVGIQGDPWVSCHIDELRQSSETTLTLEEAQGTTACKLSKRLCTHQESRPFSTKDVSPTTGKCKKFVFVYMYITMSGYCHCTENCLDFLGGIVPWKPNVIGLVSISVS